MLSKSDLIDLFIEYKFGDKVDVGSFFYSTKVVHLPFEDIGVFAVSNTEIKLNFSDRTELYELIDHTHLVKFHYLGEVA